MITTIEYKIKISQNTDITPQTASSLFQGVLMEHIESEYGEILHKSQLKPYSQYITKDKEYIYWHISTLDELSYTKIIKNLHEKNLKSIYISYKAISLEIEEEKIYKSTKDDLITKMLIGKPNRYINLKFITPTSFKSDGKYIFYPTVRLIIQSLINKFDATSVDSKIYSEETFAQLIENTQIIKYNLKSCKFHLEGVTIPSFVGNITLKVNGNERIASIVNMLVEFGEFSGVGIKTSIGMGAIKKEERKVKANGVKQ